MRYYNRSRQSLPIPRDNGNTCLLGSRMTIDLTGESLSQEVARYVSQGDLVRMPEDDPAPLLVEVVPVTVPFLVEPAPAPLPPVEVSEVRDHVVVESEEFLDSKQIDTVSIKIDGRARKNK